jgi:hypothetical protein
MSSAQIIQSSMTLKLKNIPVEKQSLQYELSNRPLVRSLKADGDWGRKLHMRPSAVDL